MHILLADDEPLLRRCIANVLRTFGHRVAEAGSGLELLERLGDERVDLIITDVEMGWLSGVHVLASARAAGVTTPAIVMSGNSVRDLDAIVARLGQAAFLEKPFLLDDLMRAIDAAIGVDERPVLISRGLAEATA